jgi:KaiC/GvpD/RAD55 family RecA-like ATPase
MPHTKSETTFWCPKLIDFQGLFAEQRPNAANACPAGFPNGSSLLLTGPPGAGKTTLALAMIRDLMRQKKEAHIIILSNEITRNKLQFDFADFGWFQEDDAVFATNRCRHASLSNAPLGKQTDPVAFAVDVAQDALQSLAQAPAFVLVDSLTSLLKDCVAHGERRRQAHNLVSKLTSLVANKPALIVLLTEQSSETDFLSEGAPPEEYVADFVFKLTRRDTGAGRRLRMLRITKSRGANMRIGDHTFAIVSRNSIAEVVAQDTYRELVMHSLGDDIDKPDWGTVLISARPKLDPIGDANARPTHSSDLLSTGTAGLDAMLSGRSGYLQGAMVERERYLKCLQRGSTTLLLGDSGSGKTLLCLQFLLNQGLRPQDLERTLYVNFENTPAHVRDMFPNAEIAHRLSFCNFLYRRRSNLDVNLWLAELCHVIRVRRIERLAIDGLSDLLATIEQKEYSRIVETLLVAVRRASKARCTMFVTYETSHDATEKQSRIEGLSVTGDNVLILQQLLVNDELRKTIYVLKARRQDHDAQLREVTVSHTEGSVLPLSIVPGLENYRNILSGKPEALNVVLRLLSENTAEHEFNSKIAARLQNIHGCTVRNLEFSRSEIISTLDTAVASSGSATPATDITLMSLDEWWVRDYGIARRPERQRYRFAGVHPLMPIDPNHNSAPSLRFPPSSSLNCEHWVFENEKATVVSLGTDGETLKSETLATPNYLDFGLFCVSSLHQGKSATDVIASVPRVWTSLENDDFAPCAEQDEGTIVGWLARRLDKRDAPKHGFVFDLQTTTTAVCTFLEFAWAFGAEEDFLARNVPDWFALAPGDRRAFTAALPATKALHFLQYLVRNKLMPYRCGVEDTRGAILSRLWYSTLRDLQGTAASESLPLPVPCFPIGAATPLSGCRSPLDAALEDMHLRFSRILGRVSAAATLRKDADLLVTLESIERALAEMPSLGPEKAIIGGFRRLASDLYSAVMRSPHFIPGWQQPLSEGTITNPLFAAAAKYIDCRDVRQFLEWHKFRLDLIEAESEKRMLASLVYGVETSTPSAMNALTGYSCSGSWLLGTLRNCHSPRMALKMIEEITSFDSAVDRSKTGAGIPARKDFYEFYGTAPATLTPHLTWQNLLDFAGSRVRRRDRTICPFVRFSDVAVVVYRELLHCLTVAHDIPSQSSEVAIESMGKILSTVVNLTCAGLAAGGNSACLTCGKSRRCGRLLGN